MSLAKQRYSRRSCIRLCMKAHKNCILNPYIQIRSAFTCLRDNNLDLDAPYRIDKCRQQNAHKKIEVKKRDRAYLCIPLEFFIIQPKYFTSIGFLMSNFNKAATMQLCSWLRLDSIRISSQYEHCAFVTTTNSQIVTTQICSFQPSTHVASFDVLDCREQKR